MKAVVDFLHTEEVRFMRKLTDTGHMGFIHACPPCSEAEQLYAMRMNEEKGKGGGFMNMILIGMPTSGKSTVGVILAKMLGMDFLSQGIWSILWFCFPGEGMSDPEEMKDAEADSIRITGEMGDNRQEEGLSPE